MVIVSHDRSLISALCDHCVLLSQGQVICSSPPAEAFTRYSALIASKNGVPSVTGRMPSGISQVISGTGEAVIESITLASSSDGHSRIVRTGDSLSLEFHVKVTWALPRLVLGFAIRDRLGVVVFGTNTLSFGHAIENPTPGSKYIFRFRLQCNLGEGN